MRPSAFTDGNKPVKVTEYFYAVASMRPSAFTDGNLVRQLSNLTRRGILLQ